MLKTYLKLTNVESVFRCLKGELGLRPIYHKRGDRVLKHMYISLLAYQAVNYIRLQLKKDDIHYSWDSIRNKLGTINSIESIAKSNKSNRTILFQSYTGLTGIAKLMYEAIGLSKNDLVPHRTYVFNDQWVNEKKAHY